jgi:hypothetical protein
MNLTHVFYYTLKKRVVMILREEHISQTIEKIDKEVDYDTFNISQRESKFVMYVLDALEDGEMNQSEVLAYLEKVKFF